MTAAVVGGGARAATAAEAGEVTTGRLAAGGRGRTGSTEAERGRAILDRLQRQRQERMAQQTAPSSTSSGEQGQSGGTQQAPPPSEPQRGSQRADPPPRTSRLSPWLGPTPGSTPAGRSVDAGAGLILGVLLWGWVGLPFLLGGPNRVRDVLRAKFFNKAPDGSWLP